MQLNIGIVGLGGFSLQFLELFLNHPRIGKVKGAEIVEKRRNHIAQQFGIEMYPSFGDMLERDRDINAVAIFSQRHQHGPMAIAALKAGKHVFSAVPVGCSIEEVAEIVKLVEETGLTYMMAETCYYYPCAVFCREKYKTGYFGEFVYGESQYYHDITAMFDSFAGSGDNDWKKVAGIPPMYYSTHSMSMIFSSINDHPTEVSCFGYVDDVQDDIYGISKNYWDNQFSNETAILKMSKGGLVRINEFRRIGTMKPSSYITGLYGKQGAYEGSGMNHFIIRGEANAEMASEDVSDLVNSLNYEKAKFKVSQSDGRLRPEYHCGYARIHNTNRLPTEIRHLKSRFGYNLDCHNGSHQMLTDDFVRAVQGELTPPNNVWESAVYTVSGIMAHQSAMENGRTLEIPFFGSPPEDYLERWEASMGADGTIIMPESGHEKAVDMDTGFRETVAANV